MQVYESFWDSRISATLQLRLCQTSKSVLLEFRLVNRYHLFPFSSYRVVMEFQGNVKGNTWCNTIYFIVHLLKAYTDTRQPRNLFNLRWKVRLHSCPHTHLWFLSPYIIPVNRCSIIFATVLYNGISFISYGISSRGFLYFSLLVIATCVPNKLKLTNILKVFAPSGKGRL